MKGMHKGKSKYADRSKASEKMSGGKRGGKKPGVAEYKKYQRKAESGRKKRSS